ncbi:amino acid ABC transporter permease [Brevibacterium casei]|uniref:Amino acid ABC transporter membrane protein 2, PAAT family (TC 3.A.1.3.-) n=2 Tax=Brevibacterium casei TaxID=33889 RepID=A0A2H1IFI6_9MICO|nr:amino acid ABC transporter permease [Brevibacterium casei]MCT2357838.1 amino acid ABC transporter permease [Brevibacterium casei]QPR40387.1 amino acid ABC transporter permease [Brevibacterium casei]QPR44542.1 amino acid ABC transporter permease [Brevibacterium casei]SMX73973.1 amino acid ABC transporter membrane protein 2, PAAT family (TC 3.A.1.3.-) [Brevibacterium casei CIP 102111]VEW11975.1 Arginine transport system permease protein ArtQ [Brevibacterium casei]
MSAPTAVLFDAPGPKARRNNIVLSIVSTIVLAGIVAFVIWKFADAGQLEPAKWYPFTFAQIQLVLLEGMLATLKVAVVASVLALAVGVVFALLRLSPKRIISVPATIVLEFFRGVPVLLLIFATFLLFGNTIGPFWSVVIGLTLYNGMVLAEIIRAGILAVPKGQREAAMAIGLRPGQVMSLVLMPQALRAMMPTIIAQVVVLLKDSALGFIVTYQDLLYQVNLIGREYNNLLPTFIVGAALFIVINMIVAGFARWLERRLQRKTTADVEGEGLTTAPVR